MNLVALLEKLERLIPSWLIALLAILIAVLYFFFNNPLHGLCDTQITNYWVLQENFLGRDTTRKMKGFSKYEGHYERCKKTNSAGGCYPYFDGFESALRSYKSMDDECRPKLAQKGRFKKVFGSFIKQVPRLAWGDEGPKSVYSKDSWLSARDLRLYCNVRNMFDDNYGPATLKLLDRKVLSKLPNPKKLKAREVRERSIIGTNCSRYY